MPPAGAGAAARGALDVPVAPKGIIPPPTLILAAIAAVFINRSLKISTFFVIFAVEPLSDTLIPIFTVLSVAISTPGVASIKNLCILTFATIIPSRVAQVKPVFFCEA